MATILLEAHGLSAVTPDGISLFSELDLVLERRVVALVGRNGSGKSTLGRMLTGEQAPDAGVVQRHARTGWLPQEVLTAPGARVRDVLGVARELLALERIRTGQCDQADLDAADGHWDLEARLAAWRTQFGLEHLPLDAAAARCSGGELTRLGLIGLLLRVPELLILDEPSNHLDAMGRKQLLGFLEQWPGGALIITHDRQVLDHVERILELSSLGLGSYPGPWSMYKELKSQEQAAASRRYEVARAERREQGRRRQAALEKQQRRQSQGRKQRRDANQAKLLLDFAEQGSEATAARLRRQHAARVAESTQREHDARKALESVTPVVITVPSANTVRGKTVLSADGVSVRFGGRTLYDNLNFELSAGQRMVVSGANGCGKSVLLKLLTGELQPTRGQIDLRGSVKLLDQHQSLLHATQGALENFRRLAPGFSEAEYRIRLARLGMRGDHVLRPVAVLSGGERLKVALAGVLLGPELPDLLLLDEPTNHQDLQSIMALEAALCDYHGTLVVVSHDQHFLRNIRFTHELCLDVVAPAVVQASDAREIKPPRA